MAINDDLKVFDDLLKAANKSLGFLQKLSKSYDRALEIRGELLDRLYEVKRTGTIRDTESLNTFVFDEALQDTIGEAPAILVDEVNKAARSTTEYSDPILLGPLLQAAASDENFKFTSFRAGKASRIKVIVDMDESAGTLNDWANAVEATRETLDSRQKSPARASNYWKFRVYHRAWKSGSYEETMAYRFAAAEGIAPYWSLLNDGNAPGKMESDWGGYPYPVNGPTNFIDKAKKRIENEFLLNFQLIANTGERILVEDPEIRKLLDKLQGFLDRMKKLIDDFAGPGDGGFTEEKVERAAKYYEEQDRAIDKEKLRKAALELISNPSKQRFELTLSGSQRTRVRRKKFISLLQLQGEI